VLLGVYKVATTPRLEQGGLTAAVTGTDLPYRRAG